MSALKPWILAYLLNALWQIPMIVVGALFIARMLRSNGPSAVHRVWVSALLLEVVLPASAFNHTYLLRFFPHFNPRNTASYTISVSEGPSQATGLASLSARLLTPVLLLYAIVILYFSCRFVVRVVRTHHLVRQAVPIALPSEALLLWRHLTFGTTDRLAGAQFAVSPRIASPVAVGIRQFTLILPSGFLERAAESDLEALFAHELAHMRRNDFAKNLLYELCTLPIAFHPLVWFTRTRLAGSREMVCDLIAADDRGRDRYARALLRLASMLTHARPASTLHVIGVFDANIFERRIMNLTDSVAHPTRTRTFFTVAACALFATAACGSALALRVKVAIPPPAAAVQSTQRIQVANGVMAAQAVSKVMPVYPAEAKANHDTLDGSVVLSAIIGKDGSIEKLEVLKSLRADYDASALDAVREWKYQPYLLNGEPVEVETTITVTYSGPEPK